MSFGISRLPRHKARTYRIRAGLLVGALLAGCGRSAPNPGEAGDSIGAADIHFTDDAVTNAAPGDALVIVQALGVAQSEIAL